MNQILVHEDHRTWTDSKLGYLQIRAASSRYGQEVKIDKSGRYLSA